MVEQVGQVGQAEQVEEGEGSTSVVLYSSGRNCGDLGLDVGAGGGGFGVWGEGVREKVG